MAAFITEVAPNRGSNWIGTIFQTEEKSHVERWKVEGSQNLVGRADKSASKRGSRGSIDIARV